MLKSGLETLHELGLESHAETILTPSHSTGVFTIETLLDKVLKDERWRIWEGFCKCETDNPTDPDFIVNPDEINDLIFNQ